MTDQRAIPAVRRRRILFINLAACLLGLAILEMSVRLWDHQVLTARNFVLDELVILHSEYPVEFDTVLGWVPKANARSNPELWGRTFAITILPDGTRSNGSHDGALNSHPVVVAVGD